MREYGTLVFLGLGISLYTFLSSSIYLPADFISLYSWMILHSVYYHIFIICPSDEGHLGCFHSLPLVNREAMNVAEPVNIYRVDVESFGPVPKSGMAKSLVNSTFIFLRTLHTDFQSDYTSFKPHQL